MKFTSLLAATASLTMMAAPALAAPTNPAASLSVSRAATPSAKKSDLAGPGSVVALVLAAAIVAGGIYIAVDDDDNSDSN